VIYSNSTAFHFNRTVTSTKNRQPRVYISKIVTSKNSLLLQYYNVQTCEYNLENNRSWEHNFGNNRQKKRKQNSRKHNRNILEHNTLKPIVKVSCTLQTKTMQLHVWSFLDSNQLGCAWIALSQLIIWWKRYKNFADGENNFDLAFADIHTRYW